MKADTRYNMSWGTRFRFLTRLLGITGVLGVAAGGLYLSSLAPDFNSDTIFLALRNKFGVSALAAALVLAIGALLAILAVAMELVSGFSGGASRRGAAGINAAAQIGIAAAILIAVNVYAFRHEANFDLTSTKQFTLPDNLVSELQKLKSETTIVVLQQHKTFGRLSEKPDRYDYAAERKVVEKVQDTVELFRRFGPQFKVVVLDVEEEGYDKKLDEVTKDDPKLREAIQSAPENSIFFASQGWVQRMSFNEFYQLDKSASKKGHGNLVLQPQGIESLVKRITSVEEKRPKVAVAVAHEWLTTQVTEGQEEFSLAGLKKSLTAYGFDVIDVVVKKFGREDREPAAASFTYQETKLNRLDDELVVARRKLAREKIFSERAVKLRKMVDDVKDKPLSERVPVYQNVYLALTRRPINLTPAQRQNEPVMLDFEDFVLNRLLAPFEKQQNFDLAEAEEEFKEIEKERAALLAQDRALEDRYLTDVKPKFTRILADCDLLIIPRMTIINPTLSQPFVLSKELHRLDKEQAEVIREFMKTGKPVLVCAGPTNMVGEEVTPANYDDLEKLLSERGVELGTQTILFNIEAKAFRDSENSDELGGSSIKIPPLSFTPPADWRQAKLAPNPISLALQALANSIDQPLDISVRALRPVSLRDDAQEKQPFLAEFLWTSPKSWSETYPFNVTFRFVQQFMQRMRVKIPAPRLDSGGEDEGGKKDGRPSVERRGPFAVAVAIESALPKSWYTDAEWDKLMATPEDQRVKSRAVVLGHGGLFSKPDLSPGTEKLLVVTCNWLLKRDDRLPHAADEQAPNAIDRPWKYPRVEMGESAKRLWHWGTFIGLPAVFVYLGLIVLMLRRVR